jgi:putative aldouronate transport system permease protein
MALTVSANPRTVDERSTGEKIADKVYWILRAAVIANVVLLFFPGFNPARMTALMNKNLSLFTCAVSYDKIVAQFGTAVRYGLVDLAHFSALRWCSLVIVVSVVISIAGACMSLGNLKLRKLSLVPSFLGAALEIFCFVWMRNIFNSIVAQARTAGKSGFDEVAPVYQGINYLYLALAVIMLVCTVAVCALIITKPSEAYFEMKPKYQLFLMMLPVVALAFVFSYLPLFGWRYAFFDYKAGDSLTMEKFVGFKWFGQLFSNAATRRDIVRVLKNTLAMSSLGILTSWVPMVFAIFLAEIKNGPFRRIVQTFTTIPNFISWVLVYAVAYALFYTDGFVNTFLKSMNDAGVYNTNYLMETGHMWLKMLAWGMWKGTGWSAIIYVASISGIDQGLYEAATVDGAGRFAKMWYITIPELIPTFMVLLLMSIANILSNGMDQYLVFTNAANKEMIQVLDLYVYNIGIGDGSIPLSTVVGMSKSIISVILLFGANGISKAVRGESIV